MTAKITRIFVPTDFSPAAEVACHLGARLAHSVKAGLIVFHAIPGVELLGEMKRAKGRTQVDVLDGLRQRLRGWFESVVVPELRRVITVEVKVKVGEPTPEIAWVAKRSGADLILMATHGRTGLAHLLMGSVTEAVLRSSPIPVLALRPRQGDLRLTAVERIMWATDLSPVSERAWRYALMLAHLFTAEVILLHAVRPSKLAGLGDHAQEDYLAPVRRELERRQQAVESLGLRARRKVVVGVPAEVIVTEAQAEQADLVIVGTHGRSGLPHVLLGSVAKVVIRKAPCPVLAVKANREPEASAQNPDEAAA